MRHYLLTLMEGEKGGKKGAGLVAINNERIKIKRGNPRENGYIKL